ncbi:hypothetical protein [Jidongwangia harbinensis]|uniref:hypothetical protein n=1 Tax=Jidongwangia harbinensis TaxID=2878561 RepID=UPI001CD9BB3C|nr:hypothetical protein [Jidongwangia harbinensis]MCA2218031.1 hypothetical protein [Jidongwangia harbinensis]
MARVDDPGDQENFDYDGDGFYVDPGCDDSFSAKDAFPTSDIIPPQDAYDHSGERHDHTEEDQSTRQGETILGWVMSELPSIERACDVLLDAEAEDRHEAAARTVLNGLQVGVRGIMDLNLRPPPYGESVVTAAQARRFIHMVGSLLAKVVSERGMEWPPPLLYPPPAVTRDLISLYSSATVGSLRRDRRPDASLRAALQVIDVRTTALLDEWGPRSIGAAKAAAGSSPGGMRSRVGLFFSGAAVLISLLQGPGAAHDFYEDALTLGGDMRDVALHVVSGISSTWSRAVSEAISGVDARYAQSPSDDSRRGKHQEGVGGTEGITRPEADMERIFASLDELVALLPAEPLEQANVSVSTAIANLHVLTGSVDYESISETAHDALDQIQAAQQSVLMLRAQIEIWKEQRGG